MSAPANRPLEVLRHDPVPGYPRFFWTALFVMGFYLLLILVFSPGPSRGREEGLEGERKTEAEAGYPAPMQQSLGTP